MLTPKGSRTFQEYAEKIFCVYLKCQLDNAERLDVIWDRYLPQSLKQGVRELHGQGIGSIRRRVQADTPIPVNWESFLRLNGNKDDLFQYLASCIQTMDTREKVIISTLRNAVVASCTYDCHALQPCDHEEADTCILLHAADCQKQGFSKFMIRTVDTDIVVLAVSIFHQLKLEEVWIAFGMKKKFRYIPIHQIAQSLSKSRCLALPVFYSLTGCDVSSFMYGKGKKTAWELCPEVTNAFLELSQMPDSMANDVLQQIERFVVVMYDKTSTLHEVNKERKELFAHGSKSMENIPPTQAALLQHTKRATYQAGYV